MLMRKCLAELVPGGDCEEVLVNVQWLAIGCDKACLGRERGTIESRKIRLQNNVASIDEIKATFEAGIAYFGHKYA
jgi:hypothetical protein